MASINYLWKNRIRLKPGTFLFFKIWAKRFLSLPELIKRNRRRQWLVRGGGNIDETAEIGKSLITGNKRMLSVGKFTFIGETAIALHEQLTIGNYVCINDGVEILTASHDISDPEWKHVKKRIQIDDYVWIGTRAIILPGVHIGHGAVVGAGAVVTKSVEPGNIVVGNPARALDKKRCKELNYNPCEFLAANRAWIVG